MSTADGSIANRAAIGVLSLCLRGWFDSAAAGVARKKIIARSASATMLARRPVGIRMMVTRHRPDAIEKYANGFR
jgi:hypothetical protein